MLFNVQVPSQSGDLQDPGIEVKQRFPFELVEQGPSDRVMKIPKHVCRLDDLSEATDGHAVEAITADGLNAFAVKEEESAPVTESPPTQPPQEDADPAAVKLEAGAPLQKLKQENVVPERTKSKQIL
jgi:hypothetical protein